MLRLDTYQKASCNQLSPCQHCQSQHCQHCITAQLHCAFCTPAIIVLPAVQRPALDGCTKAATVRPPYARALRSSDCVVPGSHQQSLCQKSQQHLQLFISTELEPIITVSTTAPPLDPVPCPALHSLASRRLSPREPYASSRIPTQLSVYQLTAMPAMQPGHQTGVLSLEMSFRQ